jgi:glyoxylase-like metal-dependent hydrolase (beta-lactamase superfamily II)/rhodanese-related sulfurtransferase
MYFKQFYLGCLAHASYLIGSEGEAAVVDPRRDVDEYIGEAEARGLRIRFVIETHLHADFVSGFRELAERTGAAVVFGRKAGATFPHLAVREGDELRLGALALRFLETPGHTPEGMSILVFDRPAASEPRMVLTGDTLFIGDVGRPDLAGSRGYTPEAMASMLYESLHEKLLRLPDAVAVYPAHGAGSLCGRNMSKETSSTIGEQRRTNYALQPMPKERFVRMVTADLPELPRYFSMDAAINREGAPPIADRPLPPPLSPAEVRRRAEEGSVVLDVRSPAAFGTGHVPGSIQIGLAGQFASWAGTLLDPGRAIVVVADDADGVREAVLRLSRVGLETVAGYLDGGIAAWDRDRLPLGTLPQITVGELKERIAEAPGLVVLDVRRPAEYQAGHVPGAVPVPLDRLEQEWRRLDPGRATAVVCAGGYRSSAATSLLKRRGFRDLANVVGGTAAWMAAGYPTEPGASS